MPSDFSCPLYLIFYKHDHHLCSMYDCALWSPSHSMCSILAGMISICSIADSLKLLTEHDTYFSPESKK